MNFGNKYARENAQRKTGTFGGKTLAPMLMAAKARASNNYLSQDEVLRQIKEAGLPLTGPNGNPMVDMDGTSIISGQKQFTQQELMEFLRNALAEYRAEFGG